MVECETALWAIVIGMFLFGLISYVQEVRRKRYYERKEMRRKVDDSSRNSEGVSSQKNG